MRIATLQFNPKLGDVEGNIKRANELLQNGKLIGGVNLNIGLDSLRPDMLVLPELALTGYNFPSLEAIKPYLEPVGQGVSAIWARETAKKYQCKVCVGYPEIERTGTGSEAGTCAGAGAGAEPEQGQGEEKYYNSLLVVDEHGEVLLNYRKTFLYYTDETWATEGDAARSFHQLTLGPSSSPEKSKAVATSFGICMDINPYQFTAPFTAWEFAHRVLDSKTELVVLSMAWSTHEESEKLTAQPDLDTFNYWIQRFLPLLKKRMQHAGDAEGDDSEKQIIIVFANRSGEEDGAEGSPPARYAGTSAIVAIQQGPLSESRRAEGASTDGGDSDGGEDGPGGEAEGTSPFDVKILCWDMMGAKGEAICFADTTADPKMVFRLARAGEE